MKQQFQVTGMSCSACSAHVEKAVNHVNGVRLAQVNLLAGTMSVEYDENTLKAADIIDAVINAGYGASVRGEQAKQTQQAPIAADETRQLRHRLSISIVFLLLLMYVSMGHMMGMPLPPFLSGMENAMSFALTQFLLTLPICFVNRKFYSNGFKTLFRGAPNMDSLIALGSGAALLYGVFALYQIGYGLGHGDMTRVMDYTHDLYFESAGMILTLITVGKTLEARAKGKTGAALASLMDLAPKTATVERDGTEQTIPVAEVLVGDIVVVRPGQSIPVDGEILEGATAIDESALTGESIPVEKTQGAKVFAATMNKTGFFKFRAAKVGDDTTLAQIIHLVEDAGASKAPIAKLADKVSGIFVPVVLGIALLSVVVWLFLGQSFTFALSTGIAVLVISCPCALGLATPVAIMVGTGKGASMGVLFKSAEALEHLHSISAIVLDKTGTVTEGKPQVTDVIAAPQITQEQLIAIAAALEKPSEHPLAEAVMAYAAEKQITLAKADHFDAKPGRGISGTIDGVVCRAGNMRFMQEEKIALGALEEKAQALAEQGKTPLFFASDKQAIGVIAVADVIKPSSAQAVQEFHKMGLEVVLLTGDNQKTAQGIGKQIGVDKVIAEVLPQDKERQIRALQEQGKRTAMVGDGINDAPALVRADVGIAIGAGADVALESAEVVLIKNDLLDAVDAIRLSRQTIRNIRQNLFWAFFYNCIGIPLAAGVFFLSLGLKLNPMFGAAAMSLSSVCVVSNALRLRWFAPLPRQKDKKLENFKEEQKKMTKTMKIKGMMCKNCSGHVTKALEAMAGISNVAVSHETGLATMQVGQQVLDDDLRAAVEAAGYEVVEIQ